jgi:energy-converting hydrogenase Eha subunit F
MGLWAGVFLIATGGKVGDENICYTNGPSTGLLLIILYINFTKLFWLI